LQSRRAGLARQLLLETKVPITDVAFASGFSSVRRFNAVMRERFHRSPTELRQARRVRHEGLVLRIDYRPPFQWESLLEFHARRAIPGVESIEDGVYRRTVRIGRHRGWISVCRDASKNTLLCEASHSLAPVILSVVTRVRRLFDLDAHPTVIDDHLALDKRLGARANPGLRLPGAFDGFETAIRAILGQQVTVKGATTLAARLVDRHGTSIETPFGDLRALFPLPKELVRLGSIGVPAARARAIEIMARHVDQGRLVLDPHADVAGTIEKLLELPGIGDWTAQYVAMRCLSWPDAFPATDLGIRQLGKDALAISERWRPWRSYAVMHLWRSHERAEIQKRAG
jgi:AraC family transcriptional regulator of adaptative response / DNA-3-methyladenine glycosylase II